MGNSLGSAPTVHISVFPEYNKIRGIILVSPIASGIKLINKNMRISTIELEKIDVFCNHGKASEIACPVFIIHGQKDEVIPIEQVKEMGKRIKTVNEWFPSMGTHNNIFNKFRNKFVTKVKLFIEYLNYYQQKLGNVDSFNNGSNKLLISYEEAKDYEEIKSKNNKFICKFTKKMTREESYVSLLNGKKNKMSNDYEYDSYIDKLHPNFNNSCIRIRNSLKFSKNLSKEKTPLNYSNQLNCELEKELTCSNEQFSSSKNIQFQDPRELEKQIQKYQEYGYN
jgi:hypothetical protein